MYSEDDDDVSPVYYRIYLGGDEIHIVTMQWFDEFDYTQDRFLTAEKFKTEDDARDFLRNAYVRIKDLDFPEKLKKVIGDFLSDDGVTNILDNLDSFDVAA